MFLILKMSSTFGGLDDSLEYHEFEFDSFDSNQAYDQSYSITDWPSFYMGKPLNNVAAVKVLEAQIPFSYYIFNSLNNTFVLHEWITGGTVDTSSTVTLPVGNYTSTTITSALKTALQSASVVNGNSLTYTVTYASLTMKLTITNNDATASDFFTFVFGTSTDIGNTNPRLALGFAAGTNTSSASSTETLTAPNVIQLTGPNYVYLNSRSLGSIVQLYLPGNGLVQPTNSGADGPQLAKIPITVLPGGVCSWQDPDPEKWFDLGNTNLSGNIDFYVTLGTGSFQLPILFNGGSFSFKLGVLTNTSSHNDWLGGGKQNDRAVSRTWPTGSQPMRF